MTLEQLEAFYTAKYPRLVKILVLLGATPEEAEDAAQRAMADFVERSSTEKAPARSAAYVQPPRRNWSTGTEAGQRT